MSAVQFLKSAAPPLMIYGRRYYVAKSDSTPPSPIPPRCCHGSGFVGDVGTLGWSAVSRSNQGSGSTRQFQTRPERVSPRNELAALVITGPASKCLFLPVFLPRSSR